ncbi:hypothetical protein H5T51_09165, partial [Candidatus Bathyarchaeota archaeon]|nr:hypothetical protein [Candidatus Bathyarchaeota archaeon]
MGLVRKDLRESMKPKRDSMAELPPNYRDVLIKPLNHKKFLVLSCDSSGAIGPKNEDVLKVEGNIVGKFIVRTALMEVMAVGAKPIGVACGLSVEPKPTGESIIKGVLTEMRKAGLKRSDLVVSTEKNFDTVQTGIGVTVIGIANRDKLLIGMAENNDLIVSVGIPSVGAEVLENERKGVIVDIEDLAKLLSLNFVHAAIPVGSKGILHEAKVLAKEAGGRLKLNRKPGIDIRKSAGPSTVILVAIEKDSLDR